MKTISTARAALQVFYFKYRGEIIISFVILFIVLLLWYTLKQPFPRDIVIITILLFITFLEILFLFNQKRLFNKKFDEINNIIIDQFGFSSLDNEYYRRKKHWAEEKMLLAQKTVKEVLPNLIENLILSGNPKPTNINIILDSGSTITPIFAYLIQNNFKKPEHNFNIEFYTNNLAGVDEIHKKNLPTIGVLNHDNITLIGGNPIHHYRATTGVHTQNFLEKEIQNKQAVNHTTIGIITANWLMGGSGLQRLSLLVRGTGHKIFKEKVIEISDYIIIVSPLGKILRIESTQELNRSLPKNYGVYEKIEIPESKRDCTFLLTSYRGENSLSPFEMDATSMQFANCQLRLECPFFEPSGRSWKEVYHIEVPHLYIDKQFKEFYKHSPRRH